MRLSRSTWTPTNAKGWTRHIVVVIPENTSPGFISPISPKDTTGHVDSRWLGDVVQRGPAIVTCTNLSITNDSRFVMI